MNEPKVPPKATLEQVSRGSVHGLDQFNFASAKQFAERTLRGFGTPEDNAAVGLASAWKGLKRWMNGRLVHDHMVVAQDVAVKLQRFLHVADAQHSPSNAAAIRCRTEPLLALDHLKQIAVGVFQIKVLASIRTGVHGS